MKQYIDDTFTARDTASASTLVCRSPTLSTLGTLLQEITTREKQFRIAIAVALDDPIASGPNPAVGIDADLTLTTTTQDTTERQVQAWHFDLVNESGWRVCTAQRTS